jgi:hypothetical protein
MTRALALQLTTIDRAQRTTDRQTQRARPAKTPPPLGVHRIDAADYALEAERLKSAKRMRHNRGRFDVVGIANQSWAEQIRSLAVESYRW